MILDLDAKRAARAEARDELPTVKFNKKTYQLVAELPLEFGEHLVAGRFRTAVEILLDDPKQVEAFMAGRPVMEDLAEIAQLYGFGGLGESSASNGSSRSTSRPSKQTSKRVTR